MFKLILKRVDDLIQSVDQTSRDDGDIKIIDVDYNKNHFIDTPRSRDDVGMPTGRVTLERKRNIRSLNSKDLYRRLY